MRAVVYVDGFNLYYGCLRRTPYKWLDLIQMSQLLLPKHQVVGVKYYTAHISPSPGNTDNAARQLTYLRALRTLPNVEIILGHFLANRAHMVLASSPPQQPRYVEVIRTEEKGSDVNLAVHLVHDGHRGAYDLAVVVSNDSDLAEAVRIVRRDLGLPVGILCPCRQPSVVLKRDATFVKPIRTGVLAVSQFPQSLRDANGKFTRPTAW
jgi:hypothetical protein